MRRFFACLFLVLGACAPVHYEAVTAGTFTGRVQLYWIGGGMGSSVGDGQFLYVKDDSDPLTFWRDKANAPSGGSARIVPPDFYTDGGSVPRVVQGVPGFNVWAFGPAYVIHDWVFVARRCLNYEEKTGAVDPDITEEIRKIDQMSFDESARLLAEGIKTLLGDDTVGGPGGVIASFTAGPVSHSKWTKVEKCSDMLPARGDETVRAIYAQSRNKQLAQSERERFTLEDGRSVRLVTTFTVP